MNFDTFELQLAITLVTLLILWLLRNLTFWITRHSYHDAEQRYRIRRRLGMLSGVVGVIVLGRTWFNTTSELFTFLALISAGLAIALRDILMDAAAWLFIVWRKPFQVGQRIEIDGIRGDVIDIRLFQFSVLELGNWVDADQSTGRVIHIPNGRIFSTPQANYSEGFDFIWNETPVIITFESNWKRAKHLLHHIAVHHTHEYCDVARQQLESAQGGYFIHYARLTPTVYTKVDHTTGIVLTLRYLVPTRKRRSIERDIWEQVLVAFAQHSDISFAYPTYRWYAQSAEPPTRPPHISDDDDIARQLNELADFRAPNQQREHMPPRAHGTPRDPAAPVAQPPANERVR